MKQYSHNSGLFTFNIPSNWLNEIEQNGNQVFWFPSAGSGTLRVSSITWRKKINSDSNPLLGVIDSSRSAKVRDDGVMWTYYRQNKYENGKEIIMYWWEFAHFIYPQHIRMAFFSFTIYAYEEKEFQTITQLEILKKLPEEIEFGPLQSFE